MDIRLKRLFLGQLYELPFCSKKCATDCSLIREPLVGPFSLGMRFSESLSMTTDLGLFRTIFDRMSIFKPLKIKVLSPILRKSVESQIKWVCPRIKLIASGLSIERVLRSMDASVRVSLVWPWPKPEWMWDIWLVLMGREDRRFALSDRVSISCAQVSGAVSVTRGSPW
jgi:hypothetical protein